MPKKANIDKVEETEVKVYSAKITDAKVELSLPDNEKYLDVRFDILLNDKVVAERRLAFPLGTTEEAITTEVKKYCQMFDNDHKLAKEAAERQAKEVEAESVLSKIKGQEVK